jgi:hypothetical protein
MFSVNLRIAILLAAGVYGTAASADLNFTSEATPDGLKFVLVSGNFALEDDLTTFRTVALTSNATAVSFNSPGGNVVKAIELGRLIRTLNLNTIQIRGLDCSSACALAFLGGVLRGAEPGSIGVHKSSFTDAALTAKDAVSAVQEMTAEVISFMIEMGVDPALLKLSLRYESDDIRYLSGSEMAEYRVTWSYDQASTAPGQMDSTYTAPSSPAAPSYAPVAPSPPPWPSRAEIASFVRTLLESHSADSARAISDVIRSYGPRISYFGKITPLADVVADKQSYFERWPERFYAIREPTLSVSCGSDACEVTGYMDWSVRSLPRNRQASGSATFRYVVAMSPNGLRVVLEDSKIVSR